MLNIDGYFVTIQDDRRFHYLMHIPYTHTNTHAHTQRALSCTQRNWLSTPTHVSLLVCTRRKADFPPAQPGATTLRLERCVGEKQSRNSNSAMEPPTKLLEFCTKTLAHTYSRFIVASYHSNTHTHTHTRTHTHTHTSKTIYVNVKIAIINWSSSFKLSESDFNKSIHCPLYMDLKLPALAEFLFTNQKIPASSHTIGQQEHEV